MQRPTRFDIFCRVVDNFGDAGVALRLARQLVDEHGGDVTLHVDDLASLARILPGLDAARDDQQVGRIRVRRLDDAATVAAADVPQVVVEAFGCGLPEPWLDAIEHARPQPVWINLEYLSAEPWIEGAHGLPSPHPRRSLTRWFFFPGFTARTGGLLRERDLLAERRRVAADPAARREAWTSLGLTPPPADTLVVSLFCYASEALPALLRAWRDGERALACIVPEGIAGDAIAQVLGDVPPAGAAGTRGALTVAVSPFVDQAAFDRRLWTSDVAFVRGEDSFVRAQWAAKPMAWHIYPQAERAHFAKLDAFLDRYAEALDPAAAAALRRFWHAFNDAESDSIARAWSDFREALPVLAHHADRWAERLAATPDLATQLVDFAGIRL